MIQFISNTVVFIFSAAIVWFFSGMLVESVSRVAKRFHRTEFSVAFFILGILTSISELSVAVNSTLSGVPQVSAGNLIGASFVLLLLVVPVLAIVGRGIRLDHSISPRNLIITFGVIMLPVLLILDGRVTMEEGGLMFLAYLALVWAIERERGRSPNIIDLPGDLLHKAEASWGDFLRIIGGGGAIFLAGHYLVEQAVYFAEFFSVPPSLIGLLLLSLGTNVPELTVAIRSVMKHRRDIAFGDYLGSAAANTLIFGGMAVASGGFKVEVGQFYGTAALFILGVTLFVIFAKTGRDISRKEGYILLSLYGGFILVQLISAFR